MTFKEQIVSDNRTVFMNLDDFSETHNINGKDIPCLIDNNELIDRERRYKYQHSMYADGIYMKQLLIFVRAEDFGPLPVIGRVITFDKKMYTISDSINEDGIYSLCLEANKT